MLKSKERQLKEIYLKDVDKIAIQMEEIWGPGVLQKLVSEDTANKFSKAKVKLNTAIVMGEKTKPCLLYTSPSPRDATLSRMPSSA